MKDGWCPCREWVERWGEITEGNAKKEGGQYLQEGKEKYQETLKEKTMTKKRWGHDRYVNDGEATEVKG